MQTGGSLVVNFAAPFITFSTIRTKLCLQHQGRGFGQQTSFGKMLTVCGNKQCSGNADYIGEQRLSQRLTILDWHAIKTTGLASCRAFPRAFSAQTQ
jgi:hypothetical protein